MKATLCFLEGAAGAGVIAGQKRVITGFCCSSVHCVSLTTLHEIPHNKDGGVVTLGDSSDSREGAGG